MTENRKTWMIEAGDVLDVMTPNKKQPVTAAPNKRYREEPRPAPSTPSVEPAKRRAAAPPKKSGLHFAPLAILTYALGPLALLLTPRGRRQQKSLVLAGMSVMASLTLALAGFGGLVRTQHPASVWAWVALVVIAVGGGFTAWARAVHLLAREGLPHVNRLPYWLRRKWSISALGLVAPGSGLLLGGHTGRAALTLWLMGPTVAAILVLSNAMGLWRHHVASGWLSASGPALETVIMVAAGMAALGFLGYIAQALEGVRQVLVEPGLQSRVKGDYYAVAVMAAVVVVAVAVNPVRLARQIDMGGDVLRAEGFQSIPLRMTLAARHLDPGQPEYSLQAVEIYTALGRSDEAAAVRAELDRNLDSYVAMVQKETVAEYGLAQATSATIARPRAAAATPAPERQAVELNPQLLVGTLVRDGEVKAGQPDTGEATINTAPRASVSRTMGLPLGPNRDGSESAPEPNEKLGPAN